MSNIVIDLGGERKHQRGNFRPPQGHLRQQWYSVNISSDAAPHIYGDVHFLPFSNNSVDCILCCEVLEHIKDPRQCCNEIWRVLKPGGVAFISAPFLFPIHADPDDYQRFTPSGLKNLTADFVSVKITPMGGSLGTLGELIVQAGNSVQTASLIRKPVKLIGRLMIRAEEKIGAAWFQGKFSTGYFVEAYKP
jgi:SAM-dependent methyltransferase